MTRQVKEKVSTVIRLWIPVIVTGCIAVAGTFKFSWAYFFVPDVERRICVKTDPILEAMELQNYLIMESMPDSSVNRAIEKYTRMRNAMKGVQR